MPTKFIERLWKKIQPDYFGNVGQAVTDLGITHRRKVIIIKTALQSKVIYGAAVDPFTQGQINTLRGRFATAPWPKRYVACEVTGLLLVDTGELEP
eukprot:7185597-Heterocapsa_arctica.AAC.1